MTVISTRKGRSVFMHDDGEVYCAIDSRGQVIDLKRKFAFDEVTDLVDSAFARRCIDALRAKLGPAEMQRILTVMVDADLITKEEARAVSDDVDVETNGAPQEMAGDSMFPHANRLKTANYAAGPRSAGPRLTPMPARQAGEYEKMFPDQGRLRG